VIPLVWSIRETRPLVRTDTHVVAHDRMDPNLTPEVLAAAGPSTVPGWGTGASTGAVSADLRSLG
jgi:hypothetical protein